LDEIYFWMTKKLKKKSPTGQNETAQTSKKRHQSVHEKYKNFINTLFDRASDAALRGWHQGC